MSKQLKLAEIAARIDKHLKRMEADDRINVASKSGATPFHEACAYAAGRYVMIRYVSYHRTFSISKERALLYMEWLDAGNNDTHYVFEAQKVKE